MTTPPLILGLGCTRQQGKDTLAAILADLDPRFVRYAFADPLKADLAPFLLAHFGVDIWTCSVAEKELVRPILIAYGMCQRAVDPDYWVKRTVTTIETDLAQTDNSIVPVITDCRFVNEVAGLRAMFPGFRYVNVTRAGAPSPTDEEEKHWRTVSALADYQLVWGNDSLDGQRAHAQALIEWLMGVAA